MIFQRFFVYPEGSSPTRKLNWIFLTVHRQGKLNYPVELALTDIPNGTVSGKFIFHFLNGILVFRDGKCTMRKFQLSNSVVCNDMGGSHDHVMTLEFSFQSMHGNVDLSITGYWLQAACKCCLPPLANWTCRLGRSVELLSFWPKKRSRAFTG